MPAPDSPIALGIVTPVFNDWASLAHLIREIDACADLSGRTVHIIAVNDGSNEPPDPAAFTGPFRRIERIRIVHLAVNLGHQRAIAVGLVEAHKDPDIASVIIMDSDGEDRPSDIERLLAAQAGDPQVIVVASRAKRSETTLFRLFYLVYKAIFVLLTGQRISFGNFCLLPAAALRSLVHNAAIWNNLAAAVSRARIPRRAVPTMRGARYAGQSRMNFASLVIHGLSAVSVYADIAMVRIIVAAAALATAVALSMLGVVAVRLFTDLAIPGWATTAIGLMSVIFVQVMLIAGVATFQLLNQRSSRSILPIEEAQAYIERIEEIALVPAQAAAS